jgi:phosphoserine phosphatase
VPATVDGLLESWNGGAARDAIVSFVERVTREGSAEYVPAAGRVAVFDNDGTLWCEKPMPIELGFILRRLAKMAGQDESLRGRQPFQAAYTNDHAWLGEAITKHYQGDDGDVKILLGGIMQAFAGWTVDEYAAAAAGFLHETRHPTLGRAFSACGYVPMVELLRYLEANGFTVFIASGGDRDFMRPVTQELYGVPPERIIGSSSGLRYVDGSVVYLAQMDVFDDGPVKPVRIWSRIGARPLVAVGNSNGDTQMLEFAGGGGREALRLLLLHDDGEREFAYTAGAEDVLERAKAEQWSIISMKDDWATVFAG